jgi:hypothetical protein
MSIVLPSVLADYHTSMGWRYCMAYPVIEASKTTLEMTITLPATDLSDTTNASDLRCADTNGVHVPCRVMSCSVAAGVATIVCDLAFTTAPGTINVFFYSYCAGYPTFPDIATFSLYDLFRFPTKSEDLFTNSVNFQSFDIIYVNGLYRFYYFDFVSNHLAYREAATVEGLGTATVQYLRFNNGDYIGYNHPTALLEGSTWHLWCLSGSAYQHLTSISASGPFTDNGPCGCNGIMDAGVRKGPDGNFYMSACEVSTAWNLLLFKASSVDGPWTAMGDVFSVIGRSGWHAKENSYWGQTGFEYYTSVAIYNGKYYITFDALSVDSFNSSAIVEFDPTTCKATKSAQVFLSSPVGQAGSHPTLLDDGINPLRMYCKSALGIYYLQVTSPLSTGRLDSDLARVRFSDQYNFGTGYNAALLGTATADAAGLHIASGNGAMKQWLQGGALALGDFTVNTKFTPASLPGSGWVTVFMATSVYDVDTQVYLLLVRLLNTGYLIYGLYNYPDKWNVLWQAIGTIPIAPNNTYEVVFSRKGTAITAKINGATDASTTMGTVLTSLAFFMAGGYYGWDGLQAQFYGTISKAIFTNEALSYQAGTQYDVDDLLLPVISAHPQTQTITKGSTLNLSVTATSVTTPTYQWQKSTNSGSSWSNVGTNSTSYSESNIQASAWYRVTITNDGGTTTSNTAVTTALAVPIIIVHPTSQSLVVGETLVLTIVATGDGTLTYQWYKGETPIGTNSPIYQKINAQLGDAGSYVCSVSNDVGSAVSNAAVIGETPPKGQQNSLAVFVGINM